jgi:hypothetical protein
MEIPHRQLLAPSPPRTSLHDVDAATETLAVMGAAKDLDRLTTLPHLAHLWISGVDKRAAAVVAQLSRLRTLVVHDWRVADLQPLRGTAGLEVLRIAGSTKLRALDGIEALRGLRELVLFDCGVADLAPLAGLRDLKTLVVEGGFSRHVTVPTLAPLAALVDVEELRLASIRVTDGSLRPLHALHELRSVFVDQTLPATELDALAAAFPTLPVRRS